MSLTSTGMRFPMHCLWSSRRAPTTSGRTQVGSCKGHHQLFGGCMLHSWLRWPIDIQSGQQHQSWRPAGQCPLHWAHPERPPQHLRISVRRCDFIALTSSTKDGTPTTRALCTPTSSVWASHTPCTLPFSLFIHRYYSMTTMKKTLQLLADRGYNNETEVYHATTLSHCLRTMTTCASTWESLRTSSTMMVSSMATSMCYVFSTSCRPSVLDAYFFGYIATVYNANIGMQPLIKRYTKIYEYYNRIMTRYFTVARGEELSTNEWIVWMITSAVIS